MVITNNTTHPNNTAYPNNITYPTNITHYNDITRHNKFTRHNNFTPITAWTAYDLIDGTLKLGAGNYLAYHKREQKYIAVVVFSEPLTDSWLALFKDAVKSQKQTWTTGRWGVTETCRYGYFKKEGEALDWLKSCIK